MITTKVTGLDKAIANFSESSLTDLNTQILLTAKDYTVQQVMPYTPIDTGRLRGDWPGHFTVTPLSIDVKNIVEYAPYQENGVPPRPRKGKPAYLKSHSTLTRGYKGAHMAQKAAADLKNNIGTVMKSAMRIWLSRFKS